MLPDPDPFLPADTDRQVGTLFAKLASLNRELGEPSHRRAVQAALHAIGVTALAEAERRARQMAARGRPHPGDVRVTAYADRKRPEPLDDDGA